jgi:AcrR family transcriptional regulator
LIRFVLLNKRLIKMKIKQEKREEILEVAELLFAEQGFEAVSIREISKVAKINIAMVSYYFGSKEKLYEEVIRRKLISAELIKKQIEHCTNYKEQLFCVVDFYIDSFIERRLFQNIIFREISMNQRTQMADAIIFQINRNFSFIAEIIKNGIKRKEFQKVDVELTVMSIVGIIRMYVTSGNMACKILNLKNKDNIFDEKHRTRMKQHLYTLLSNHLIIK